jgi:hypothetical protein
MYTGLGLWCLTPFSTIIRLYREGQFYWWMKPEYPEKTTDCHKALSHIVVSSTFLRLILTSVINIKKLFYFKCLYA